MDSDTVFATFQVANVMRRDVFALLDKAKADPSTAPPLVAALMGAADGAHQVAFHMYTAYLAALEAEGVDDSVELTCVNAIIEVPSE